MSKQAKRTYTVREDELEAMLAEAAKRGAEVGISSFRSAAKYQREKREKDIIYATSVLIKKYRDFKAMAEKAIVDAQSIEDECTDDELVDVINQLMQYGVDQRELDIVSNKKRVYRTKALMNHVDVMLEAYRLKCATALHQDEQRRYRVIYALYIAPEPISTYDLAEREHIGMTSLYDTIKKATRDLALLIWGIDGIKL